MISRYFGEPNGNRYENCAIVWVNRDMWNDQECTGGGVAMCGFCEMEEAPNVVVRGE